MASYVMKFFKDMFRVEPQKSGMYDLPEGYLISACVVGTLMFVAYILIQSDDNMFTMYLEENQNNEDEEQADDEGQAEEELET